MDLEKPIRQEVIELVKSDFDIWEEVEGIHRNNSEKVRCDLLLKPKQRLIERGFHNGYVVVECKCFKENESQKHDVKFRDLLWQCLTYSYSDFYVNEGYYKPLFSLFYTKGKVEERFNEEIRNYIHFMTRGGVGMLHIDKYLKDNNYWEILFGSSRYFHQMRGKGESNVGIKRMVGSAR